MILTVTGRGYGSPITPSSSANSMKVINDEIWVATAFSYYSDKGYIYRFNYHNNDWKMYSFPKKVLCIENSDSNIYLGTYGKGIIIFDSKNSGSKSLITKITDSGDIDEYESNCINAIVIDTQNIYCATPLGLSIYNIAKNTWKNYNSKNSPLPEGCIYDIKKKENKIWLTSSDLPQNIVPIF